MEQKAIKRKKAAEAFASMRTKATEKGYMTDKEIEAEIAAARQESMERTPNEQRAE